MVTTFTLILSFTITISLAVYLLLRKIKKSKSENVLIEFKIGTTDGFYYNVEPEKVTISMDSNERIRVVLGFISQLLTYTTSTNNSEKNDILKFIKEVSRNELSQEAIIQYFKREFAFELYVREAKAEGKIIVGRLFKEGNDREFHASVPSGIFKYQLLFSSASLLNLIVGRLDARQRVHLQRSLNYIADFYFNTISNPIDGSTVSNLENTAYGAGLSKDPQAGLKFG